MSVVAALLAGGALGARHALEADHVAAVTTLDADGRVAGRGGAGAWWGLGHGVPIAALGLGALLLGIEVPAAVPGAFEAVAGLLLVCLGAWTLLGPFTPGFQRHVHGGRDHAHLSIGRQLLGTRHRHVDPPAVVVGVVHGLAGSGALVVALASTSPTRATGAAFVGGFAAATVATMVGVSAVWRRLEGTAWLRPLRGGAGAVAVGLGLGMVVAGLGLLGPL